MDPKVSRLRQFCFEDPKCTQATHKRTVSTSTSTRTDNKLSEREEIQFFYDAMNWTEIDATVPSPTFSIVKQTASEGEWLQEDTEEVIPILPRAQPGGRFDWRRTASSRLKKPNSSVEKKSYARRMRAQPVEHDPHRPFYSAVQRYRSKFMQLLAHEEAEDEAVLRHRLSTWSLKRLETEGYCMTGLSAYWLQANQFGRPVASFLMGPGIKLPENKLENGTQVLLSRVDPLKECPQIGSVLSRNESHIRICFPNHFDLHEGVWRLDLGRPNLMYERMRNAISNLDWDPQEIEKMGSDPSTEYILQGTELRDVILKSFVPPSPTDEEPTAVQACENVSTAPTPRLDAEDSEGRKFEEYGAFKLDQRILSWARRYSRSNPVVVEGDPPLSGMNASQIRAMAAMIGQRMCLIQGPPGTGKTKTIIETIKLLKVHFQVPQPLLVCTYTNVAVDNLVEGFARVGVKPLRVGFNGNVRQSLLEHSLDYKLEQHPLHPVLLRTVDEETQVKDQVYKLSDSYKELALKLKESKRPRKATIERAMRMKEALISLEKRHKNIKRKIYAIQQQMLRETIADADVICTTCITSACAALNVIDFPVVFLDEASMSTEPASLIPIVKGSQHVALIGDHKQLPPVITSKRAKEDGLGLSLFERLTEEGHVPSVMLDIQYRMHPTISKFPAREFYGLALQDGTVDVFGKPLPSLEPPRSKHLKKKTGKEKPSVIFLDHTGNESFKGRSRVNITEGHIVASIVEDLLLANKHLHGRDIGVIAPYAAQITHITRLLNLDSHYKERFEQVLGLQRAMQLAHIEIKTVDGFEGREKEVIIFSTVRNNSAGHIGFLADRKRLNVGLTRAKRGLFVVGNLATLGAGKMAPSAVFNEAAADADSVADADASNGEKTKKSKAQRGSESWFNYARWLMERGLVISLSGPSLEHALYGHWNETQKWKPLLSGSSAPWERPARLRVAQ
ncbi:unnamed protein product [Cyclocybe aegerita]|uniref:P-loop containing nucleoside triphosphate hydrolase protein n=1 Tax=Cyclocybe aegerita TaxID=1973307 RepID=A0A8S0VUD1_CYCAE|nr:unnamed protein product [Cyclocybe aegerita]